MVVINCQFFPPNPLLSSDIRAILFSTWVLLTSPTEEHFHRPFWKPCFSKDSGTLHQPWTRLTFSRRVVLAIILANKALYHFKIILLLLWPASEGLMINRAEFPSPRWELAKRKNCRKHQRKEEFHTNTHLCSFFPGSNTEFSEVMFQWLICIEILLFP